MAAERMYNDPPGTPSTVGTQINTHYYEKAALIEARKTQFFTQLADAKSMPKHFGKTIKLYHYLPLLDDRNINDQGIDAAGVTITTTQRYISLPRLVLAVANASKAAAAAAINDNINNGGVAETIATAGADDSGGAGLANITCTKTVIKFATNAKAQAVVDLNLGAVMQLGSGNLYGTSKDVGLITGKLPVLSETGGRVNRVGFKRLEISGTFEKFGFFDEYTRESLDFDTDAGLQTHVHREMVNGASEITEDALQIDLLTNAATVRLTGGALSVAALDEDGVTYGDLMRLSIDLDNVRTPKQLTAFTGTRLTDTKTIPGARALYIGSELLPTIKAMKDLHNNPAFTSVEKYQAGGATLLGEVGSIDQWRVIVVPEMMKWAGAGDALGGVTTHYSTAGRFDVFPMLAVGEGAFTTISFQTDGKEVKFSIIHKPPSKETADRNEPYGELGFMSIKWYYGFLLLRGERLGLIKTTAIM